MWQSILHVMVQKNEDIPTQRSTVQTSYIYTSDPFLDLSEYVCKGFESALTLRVTRGKNNHKMYEIMKDETFLEIQINFFFVYYLKDKFLTQLLSLILFLWMPELDSTSRSPSCQAVLACRTFSQMGLAAKV